MATVENSTKAYLAIDEATLQKVCKPLQHILANTIYMHQLYKKYHWHIQGENFYQYHLLFDKHANEQLPLIDAIAERLRTLGATAPGMPQDVTKNKTIHEQVREQDRKAMLMNLVICHKQYIETVRKAIEITQLTHDDGTNDLLVSQVLRTHELQSWFVRSCQ